GSRADDDDIAGKSAICRDDDGVDRLRCGWWRSERARVSNRARCGGRRVMRDGGEALQRLKCLATRRQAARRPAAEAALALAERHAGERLGDAAEQQIDDAVVEHPE